MPARSFFMRVIFTNGGDTLHMHPKDSACRALPKQIKYSKIAQ